MQRDHRACANPSDNAAEKTYTLREAIKRDPSIAELLLKAAGNATKWHKDPVASEDVYSKLLFDELENDPTELELHAWKPVIRYRARRIAGDIKKKQREKKRSEGSIFNDQQSVCEEPKPSRLEILLENPPPELSEKDQRTLHALRKLVAEYVAREMCGNPFSMSDLYKRLGELLGDKSINTARNYCKALEHFLNNRLRDDEDFI